MKINNSSLIRKNADVDIEAVVDIIVKVTALITSVIELAIVIIEIVNQVKKNIHYEELIRKLKLDPKLISKITPYDFEEVIGKLFASIGYEEVIVTSKSKDGGKDIVATFKTPSGDKLSCWIECKKKATNPVGVNVVKAFFGTLIDNNINHGIVVTTSKFTRGAKDFQLRNKNMLFLKDGEDIKALLSNDKPREIRKTADNKQIK